VHIHIEDFYKYFNKRIFKPLWSATLRYPSAQDRQGPLGNDFLKKKKQEAQYSNLLNLKL